jgi:hypothetical protein
MWRLSPPITSANHSSIQRHLTQFIFRDFSAKIAYLATNAFHGFFKFDSHKWLNSFRLMVAIIRR